MSKTKSINQARHLVYNINITHQDIVFEQAYMWTTNINVVAKDRIKLVSAGYTFCRFMNLRFTKRSIVEHLAMKYSLPTETGKRNTHRTNYRKIPCCWSNRTSLHTWPEASEQWHVAVELRVTDTSHILYMFGLVRVSYKIIILLLNYSNREKKQNKILQMTFC